MSGIHKPFVFHELVTVDRECDNCVIACYTATVGVGSRIARACGWVHARVFVTLYVSVCGCCHLPCVRIEEVGWSQEEGGWGGGG